MNFLGLRTKKYAFLFIFIVAVCGFLEVSVLLESPVTSANVNVVTLHLGTLTGNRPARGSLNYDLYVKENNNHYKIGTGYADCFHYDDFALKVAGGDAITLAVRKDNGLMASDLYWVVSLKAGNVEYLSSDCVNEHIKSDKTNTPFFALAFLAVLYLVLRAYDEKNYKSKHPRVPSTEK